MSRWEAFSKYPQWICFIIAGAFLYGAFVNANTSERMQTENYQEVEAEICNLETVQVLRYRRHVTRYHYDIVWYADGVKHIKHMQEQVDAVPEGKTKIWVSADQQKCTLSSSEEIMHLSNQEALIAVLAGIAGAVLCVVRRKEKGKRGRKYRG